MALDQNQAQVSQAVGPAPSSSVQPCLPSDFSGTSLPDQSFWHEDDEFAGFDLKRVGWLQASLVALSVVPLLMALRFVDWRSRKN